jgi:dihydroorotase
MSRILLQGGRLLCPASGLDETGDLLIEDQTIAQIGGKIKADDAKAIPCDGLVIAPGLIDVHVHLRQPGHEYKESIASGTAAAAAGGFTAVACMPNTSPVNDSRAVTDFILETAAKEGSARVYPVGAITMGLKGAALTEMAELQEAGCVAVSDDGRPVADARLMRRALEYAATFDLPVICHSEELSLSAGGHMHEGPTSTRLGITGIPAQAEVLAIERDLALAGLTSAKVHIAHVSCAGSVEAIKRAKAHGIRCTAETAPHYLALSDEDVGDYDTHFKMNPPLRSSQDRQAVRQGLADGVIDMVATDHAPHSVLEKEVEFDQAAFGVVGLETALGVMLQLVEEGVLDLAGLIQRMSAAPAKALGLRGGSLALGGPADVTVFSDSMVCKVEPEKFRSLSRNTPFAGWELPGRAVLTICAGRITHRLEKDAPC